MMSRSEAGKLRLFFEGQSFDQFAGDLRQRQNFTDGSDLMMEAELDPD